MGNQRADLVEHQRRRNDAQIGKEGGGRNRSNRHECNQANRPKARSRFHDDPISPEFARRHCAAIGRVDRQCGDPRHHFAPHPRNEQRQRRKHRKAQQKANRAERRNAQKINQHMRLHQRERQIFGIFVRAITHFRMMLVMRIFIEKGRNLQGHSQQQIPHPTEPRHMIALHMGDFVDETGSAV